MRIRLWILAGSLFYLLLFICAAHAQISATLSVDPEAYSGSCPADIRFKGTITSEKPGKVQYTFIRSDGVLQPVETLDFSAPGAKEVSAVWTAGGQKSQRYEGWGAIKIVYPEVLESNKTAFRLVCDQTTPDLTIRIKHCPKSVKPGHELGPLLKVVAVNRGEVSVKDVDLDIVLKKENACPVPTPMATYSAHFSNGVLLKGGHEQVSLNGGQKLEITLTGANTIPTDTPAGEYFLCAVIDAGDKIKESNETNNCACCPVKVTYVNWKARSYNKESGFQGLGKMRAEYAHFYL